MTRADRNNNPAEITTELARAWLTYGIHYVQGDPLPAPSTKYLARLLGDPIAATIKLLDHTGFHDRNGFPHWDYIDLPKCVWDYLTPGLKAEVIKLMYKHNGGTALLPLFKFQIAPDVAI